MIITVTMNPAIDKTADIHTFTHGGLNRILHMERDAGGKGINVSKTIQQLGGTSIATGFLAGNAGAFIKEALQNLGIVTDFIQVPGETRTNTKIVEENGTVTELNEPGPQITEAHISELIQKLEDYASENTLIVLAGSIPAGTDPSLYRTIIEKMHARGASVLLDADGPLFSHAMKAHPDIVKPNLYELEQYFEAQSDSSSANPAETPSRSSLPYQSQTHADSTLADQSKTPADSVLADQSEIHADSALTDQLKTHADSASTPSQASRLLHSASRLLRQGIQLAAISMGADGALFLTPDQCLKCPGLPVKAHSTVGAGDAMVAALVYGWENKLSLKDCASLAMAASAGAVTTIGTKPPTLELVQELQKRVLFEEIPLQPAESGL